MASGGTPATLRGRLASLVVSVATAFVLLGVAILPFFTPQWIHAEQARAGAHVPGYTETAATYATDMTVSALLFGGGFAFIVDPAMPPGLHPVSRYWSGTLIYPPDAAVPSQAQFFDEREIEHMDDVRGVFGGLAAIVIASLVALVLAAIASRGRSTLRARVWRAIASGAAGLAGFMVVVGVLSVVAFDAAFELFHELLFPAGSFLFDPAKERLVQIFPDQFWSDTTLALGLLALGLAVIVALVGRRRAGSIERAAGSVASPGAATAARIHGGSPA